MSEYFRFACQRGDLQTVQRSIAEVSGYDRTSGLVDAAGNGHAEVVQWLIEHGGCDVNARNSEALFVAIMWDHFVDFGHFGHFDVVKILVEHGVNTNAKVTYSRHTPLISAATRNNKEISRLLIKNGANVDGKDARGQTAIFCTRSLAIVEILVDGGANVNVQDSDGRTPLMIHAEKGNKDIVSYLIAHGADVDRGDTAGQTALHLTVYSTALHISGHLSIVKILVDGGANVNVQDKYGCTPLIIHAEKGNKDIVSYFIAHGADVDRKDPAGRTALHISGHLSIVKILVDVGANVNVQDKYGRTPLMIHADKGNKDIVSYLVTHGADVDRKDSKGQTALHYVCHRKQKWSVYTFTRSTFDLIYCEIVELLVGHGSNIEERDCYQFTPLVHSALRGNQILAWQLIEGGADMKQLNMTEKEFKSQYNESRETQGHIERFTYSNLRLCKEAFLRIAAFTGNTELVTGQSLS